MSVPFYRAFEDRYRGSRELITARLRAYLPFIEAAQTLAAPGAAARALDLGCGRGEWLELLGGLGVDAGGVDLDDGMLAACHERGLRAEHADVITSLRAQPDDSLELVSAFHLVEHIPFAALQTLIAEALRALRPGGLLIMETPNPENLSVGATSFYLDPSHERPLPPMLLGFLAEYSGYARQRTVRLQEAPELLAAAPLHLIDVLEGVSSDYAIVAQKAAAPAVAARFDAAFARPYGFGLGQAAQRYETEHERQRAAVADRLARHGDALAAIDGGLQALDGSVGALGRDVAGQRARQLSVDAELGQLQQRAAQSEATLAALAMRLEDGDRHAAEARAHAAAAQARADAHAQQVLALRASSSWRITAPWRLGGRAARALREGRVGSGLRRRLRAPLLVLMRAVLRRPRMKRAARSLLRFSPALQHRLQGLLQRSAAVETVLQAPPAPAAGDMSPRTLRHYRILKSLLETGKH